MQGLHENPRSPGSKSPTHPAPRQRSLARAVIKRATGLNDLYCHIGAFIMTLDRPPPPPRSSSPLKRILRALAGAGGRARRGRSVCACKGH